MKKKFGCLAGVFALLLLAGCASQGTEGAPSVPVSPAGPTESVETAPVGTEEALPVHIDYASQSLLSQPDTFDEFIADDSEFQVKVVFTADEPVEDFQLVTICLQEMPGDEIAFRQDEVLYQMEQLSPQRPLVVGMVFAGDTPNMGVTFVDQEGQTQQATINMSGKDGSLFLMQEKFVDS